MPNLGDTDEYLQVLDCHPDGAAQAGRRAPVPPGLQCCFEQEAELESS